MTEIASFRDVIDLWPNASELAKRLGAGRNGRKITPGHVRVWYSRNRIPPGQFDQIAKAAKACGFSEVTYRLLSRLRPGFGPDGTAPPPKRAGN